ncbi:MAG: hypothetical protein ACYC91_11880 [Solirubrobacteraceae bacterium]
MSARPDSGRPAPVHWVLAAILAGGLLGALLLILAEFTPLYTVHASGVTRALKSMKAGPNHAYALAVLGGFAAVMALGIWRTGSRPALMALGIIAVLALLIGLLGDLPDAQASGLVRSGGRYLNASSSPSVAFFMETLGAVVLVITCVSGFVLLGPPATSPPPPGTTAVPRRLGTNPR